ncbi:hypothetical protein [Streptomyces sp. NPDC017260]|uniref:hypothetical protein n=1 Tax=unclassified Streptomyces TaxID=2593676 RepID=UPI00378F99F1
MTAPIISLIAFTDSLGAVEKRHLPSEVFGHVYPVRPGFQLYFSNETYLDPEDRQLVIDAADDLMAAITIAMNTAAIAADEAADRG